MGRNRTQTANDCRRATALTGAGMSIFDANTQWANTLVYNLAAAGVTQVVVSPGSRNTPLVLACDRCPQLNIEVVLDERAAAFVALGMSRVSGTPTALVCTSGSACAHYLPAIIEARYSRIPLIVLSADRPAELHNCGAPQTINQEQIFGKHVVASFELKAPNAGEANINEAAALAVQAVRMATGSPQGPVHLNLPFRKPMWEASQGERSFVPHI
ncbi:MAG TPA: 2-succinyl-5-enolpyruvyl-6-hydroxy-3-cyclohexene-1-carboxylic-acid synthase, partial [Myxococcales bacterium]|nr:2-succinyl-5-enolpyruvyl-6-hydroxy-3-cyclohexene-1-carboxylic-acid synthase [Myxococcales bacterium]